MLFRAVIRISSLCHWFKLNLSGGVAQSIRDAALVVIRIKPPNDPFINAGLTKAGLKAQMMPLLPFSSSHTGLETTVGPMGHVELWMQIG
jgi:hypothetical protein